ncbi:MAG: RIO1 family regulatory kinase/ATPase, partial [Pseudomonadales bacterium]
ERTIDLMGGGFTRGMLAELEQKMVLEAFGRHVAAVEQRINDGKEATVYLCRAVSGAGGGFLAAKVYRDRRFRAFASNSSYTDPGRVRDRRMAKAIRKRTRVGRKVSQRLWVDREWEALRALFDAGASVPEPYDHAPDAVLMEFVGDAEGPAPMLAHTRLTRAEAERAYGSVLRDVALLLECGLVHGDLSAYNILYHRERPRVIDLPQAVGLDDAVDAWSIFYRDMENIGSYFVRQGVPVDTTSDAMRLWQRHAM